MKLTIVVPDGVVIVNGRYVRMSLAGYDFNGVKVVQFDGDAGWLEYHDGRRNVPISADDLSLEPFASVVREYDQKVAELDAQND